MAQRALTIRVPDSVFSDLAAHAEKQRSTVADVIRGAISEKIGGVSNAVIMEEIKSIKTLFNSLTISE